jgi:hypothetical protein
MRSTPSSVVAVACVLAIIGLGAHVTPAVATPFFEVSYSNVENNLIGRGFDYKSGATEQTVAGSYSLTTNDGQTFSQNEFAKASQDGLRASSRATVMNTSPGGGGILNLEGDAAADFTLDDVVFSGPAGGTIPVTLLMRLDGTIETSVSGLNPGRDIATVLISGGIFDPAGLFSPLRFSGTYRLKNDSGTLSITRTGILSDYAVENPPEISAPMLNVPTGRPLELFLSLETLVTVFPADVLTDAISDFSHTLSFPSSGPVFLLPPGYSVNSAEGGIVDNQYVTGPAAAVPAPSTIALILIGGLGSGAASVIASRCRRR